MSALGIVALVLYGLTVIYGARRVVGMWIEDFAEDGRLAAFDAASLVVLVPCFAAFGPFILAHDLIESRGGVAVDTRLMRALSSRGPESRDEQIKRLERDARDREERIRELEAEVGL